MRRGLVGRSVGWGGCPGQQMHSRIPVTTARADGLCLWGANGRLHGNRRRRWRPYRPNSRAATVRNICRYFSTTKHQHTHSNNKRHPASYYYLFLSRPTFYSFLFRFTFRRFFSRNISSIFLFFFLCGSGFFAFDYRVVDDQLVLRGDDGTINHGERITHVQEEHGRLLVGILLSPYC
jgi:hypothetical protein